MRDSVLLVLPWLVVGFTTCGCEYIETQPGSGAGQGGAVGEGSAGATSSGTSGDDDAGSGGSTSPTASAAEQACMRVCSVTTQSSCAEAQTDLEVCTTSCEAALRGSCGSTFTDYVVCAQDGGEVVCSYGPVIQTCEDLFWAFIDCAGLEP